MRRRGTVLLSQTVADFASIRGHGVELESKKCSPTRTGEPLRVHSSTQYCTRTPFGTDSLTHSLSHSLTHSLPLSHTQTHTHTHSLSRSIYAVYTLYMYCIGNCMRSERDQLTCDIDSRLSHLTHGAVRQYAVAPDHECRSVTSAHGALLVILHCDGECTSSRRNVSPALLVSLSLYIMGSATGKS